MHKIMDIKTGKIIFLLLLIILPWFNSNFSDAIEPELPRQEDLTYYEINPCKVSLGEFVISNFTTTYQDHYYFKFQDYSSIKCFGKIAGVSLVNDTFIISVGTNNFINIVLQTFFWLTLLSFVKRSDLNVPARKLSHYLLIGLSSYFLTFAIYAEKRFYEKKFYYFDLAEQINYIYLFILLFSLLKLSLDIVLPRESVLINSFPFMYLFMGVFGGFNYTLYYFIFIFYGIYSYTHGLTNKYFSRIYLLFGIFWVSNASGRYYLEPSKLRGFTSSIYDFNAVVSWTIGIYLLINGLLYFIRSNQKFLNILKVTNSLSLTSILITVLGLLGSNFPLINFFNYFYTGQQKFGVRITNPLIVNEWNEKVSWRGFYTSAESIGEFYGLAIIFILFVFFENRTLSRLSIFGLISSSLGLYFSNNRTVFILLLLILVILLAKQLQLGKRTKVVMFSLSGLFIAGIIGFQNLSLPYSYTSNIIFNEALNYRYDSITSSFLNFMIINSEQDLSFSKIYGFIGFVAYFLNRSELWGIFSTRYNPSDLEVFVGSGPMNFGQLYGEILIGETRSFLLPHSSILSLLIFVGITGLLIIATFIMLKLFKNRYILDYRSYLILIYLSLNLLKNDTINYFSSFSFYLFLIYIFLNTKTSQLFISSSINEEE